jgi:hypothetical protein
MHNGKRLEQGKAIEMPYTFLGETSPEAIIIQRNFIQYLVRRMEKMTPDMNREECVVLVITRTGEGFRRWFDGMANVETKKDFYHLYGTPEGPERIFREIFPDQNVEDFLYSCLNVDDGQAAISVCAEAVSESVSETIK